jgi:hypothetical protein
MEAHRVLRLWGSNIIQKIGSQMISLSALSFSRPLPPRKIPGTHFWYRLSQPQGHSAAGRIRPIGEKSTTPRLEPATFLLVAWCLIQLRYRVSNGRRRVSINKSRRVVISRRSNRICIIKILIQNKRVLYHKNYYLNGKRKCRSRESNSGTPKCKF